MSRYNVRTATRAKTVTGLSWIRSNFKATFQPETGTVPDRTGYGTGTFAKNQYSQTFAGTAIQSCRGPKPKQRPM